MTVSGLGLFYLRSTKKTKRCKLVCYFNSLIKLSPHNKYISFLNHRFSLPVKIIHEELTFSHPTPNIELVFEITFY